MQELTLCTTSEVARRFGVDSSTVRRWVATGKLQPKVVTPGGHHRFDPADVEALVAPKSDHDEAGAR